MKSTKSFYRYCKIDKEQFDELLSKASTLYHPKKIDKLTKRGKPTGKTRTVYKINNQLRGLLVRIKNLIQQNVPTFPDYMMGGIKGRSNKTNASFHIGLRYYTATDIENCFPSISRRRVFFSLSRIGFSPKVANLIADITTYNDSLPQGSPVSPLLCNLVLLPMATEMHDFCDKHEIKFTIYVDDLSFTGQTDLLPFRKSILAIIRKHGFRYSWEKTKSGKGKFTTTGCAVGSKKIDVASHIKHRINSPKTSPATKKQLLAYQKYIRK